ncbi:MAG: DoxX family membrane protein [Bdellovibrio sp.]|nr:DoxX family membrane protein [Bdellovibrio sp.]
MKNLIKCILILLLPLSALAHVKWFTKNTDLSVLKISELNQPTFWLLLGLSTVTLALMVYVDRALDKWRPYQKFNSYLEGYADRVTLILRVFTGAALLLSWEADSMIAPELKASSFVGWVQFVMVLLLLTKKTTAITGMAMVALYFYGINQFGSFHMLDYLVYPAIGYFLLVADISNRKISQTRVPVLYIGLGFSLCWAALEKLFFPHWGLDVLRQQPELTMGLPADFFLMASAFVELCLGYLLIIGLLQRPLALTITLVFFSTSAIFGKTEVIGHTILHGALLVFVIIGPGQYYPTPIQFHHALWKRAVFAAVNFVIIGGIFGYAYYLLATK